MTAPSIGRYPVPKPEDLPRNPGHSPAELAATRVLHGDKCEDDWRTWPEIIPITLRELETGSTAIANLPEIDSGRGSR
jgi:hypothetical protein